MGKAVVSTSIGCEGIDVENGKNIYVADTKNEFAQRIVELLEDSNKRDKLGEAGLLLVREKYQWERVAEQIENEYERIIK
jgi:glycosyltransferase involved in cell wall biosynthesis